MTTAYIPDSGDLVWLDFNPQTGREQANRRPAVVLSPATYNGKVKLGIFCPITTKVKGYPFEVALPDNLPIAGVVLADQVKSTGKFGKLSLFAKPQIQLWQKSLRS